MERIERRHTPYLDQSYTEFSEYAETYGAKAAGLRSIPHAWCPTYLAISVDVYLGWEAGQPPSGEFLSALDQWLESNRDESADGFIVRSSGIREDIADRGKFQSIRIPQTSTAHDVMSCATEIFTHARKRSENSALGIILQVFLSPTGSGHLSNEVRVSPTRNQWQYEVDFPGWAGPRGLNSKYAPRADPTAPITSLLPLPHASLRSVGKWLTDACQPRVHIEWIVARRKLWVVQLDFEWRQLDTGADPNKLLDHSQITIPNVSAARIFDLYKVGTPTRWKKLKNLDDFDFDTADNAPRLFISDAAKLDAQLRDDPVELATEIERLTAGRAVVRMEIASGQAPHFNLPRTETVNGAQAMKWIAEQIAFHRTASYPLDDISFITHAFLPAHAGVWAYADPGEPLAFVDALWGLPDGLQVLPHDTFEVDIAKQRVTSESIRYKPRFLQETPTGDWSYINVLKGKSRSSVLRRSDAVEIGVRTARIAKKLGERAQIMWFSGVPTTYGVGRNLPWFRARETFDPSPRQRPKFRPFNVSGLSDLDHLPTDPVTLHLDPEADLIRSDAFLDAVIDAALSRNLPVEIRGSALSHTYYRLFQAGVAVNPPVSRKFHRSRGRRIFGKLVRDRVPESIKGKGEIVREGTIAKEDVDDALIAKLLEEVSELRSANDHASALEELADVYEVVQAIALSRGFEINLVEAAAKAKRDQRGSFTERRVLIETSLAQPNARTEGPIEIGLRELDAPRSTGAGSFVFPYSSVIRGASVVEDLPLKQRLKITARVSRDGLIVQVVELAHRPPEEKQLELF